MKPKRKHSIGRSQKIEVDRRAAFKQIVRARDELKKPPQPKSSGRDR